LYVHTYVHLDRGGVGVRREKSETKCAKSMQLIRNTEGSKLQFLHLSFPAAEEQTRFAIVTLSFDLFVFLSFVY